jgi:hypothetical protein
MVEHELLRHVAWSGEKRNAYRVLWGNMKERDHLEEVGRDGGIILKRCRMGVP